MARPRLSKIDSWGKHENRVRDVFALALGLLRKQRNLPVEEVDINRKFWFCIHRANRVLSAKGKGLVCPPNYDSRNAPDADDKERAAREEKRPDFSCGLYDPQEPDPEKSAKFYVIECKRLGSPCGTWKLNRNYVEHGVRRFVEPEWGYGKSVRSGGMIGYVQGMTLSDILTEVNQEARRNQLSAISLSGEWKEGAVSQLEQVLTRPQINPRQFELRHMWVDLRAETSLN